jgi:hypothetical protein
MIVTVLLAATVAMATPSAAQACMNCPCLNIKKDGPCLLR